MIGIGMAMRLNATKQTPTQPYDPYLRALLTEAGDELATESNLILTLE